ncbi:uncharacterized protein LOC114325689 [Diabrotica virgifera virgifera]|uniref:Uncharacterized protein LOC114325689 n=1 Tax=Diabrotica virgifera virgifera TaxID=50390 RepID=A0A6P7F843_DIAVI|nr:uncharacterized protein LOC114325689 [Diabrotica virgifera virgifera]
MFGIIVLIAIPCVLASQSIFATESFFPSDEVEVFSNTPEIMGRIENFPNKNEPFRRFLKSYNSLRPIGLLVDDTKESSVAATGFMKNIFKVAAGAKQITFSVLRFNSTGSAPILEIKGSDTEQLYDAISYKIRDQNLELGVPQPLGAVAFFATLQAAAALPTDSAIVIFIDRKINDEDLAGHTAIFKKKNIRVYVIWGGPYPTRNSEERLLQELCSYSGGLFLFNNIKDLSGYNYRNFISGSPQDLNTSIIFAKSNITEDSTFNFPIDSEVIFIHIILTPEDVEGTLTTSTGHRVTLTDNDDIASYGTGSFGFTERGHREIFLDATQGVGVWSLHVRTSSSIPCNVKVYARTRLTAQAYFVRENTDNAPQNKMKILKLDFTGDLGSVENISFFSNDGRILSNNLKYTIMKNLLVIKNNKRKQLDIELTNVTQKSFQVQVEGTDGKGNRFSRLTYVNDYSSNNIFPQPVLSVDVGVSSELIIPNSKTAVITFEVTNLRNSAADTRFYCKDEKSILGSMQPYRTIISPQATAIVTLILSIRYGIYQDLITFTAAVGSEYVEKRVIVDVGSQLTNDNVEPTLDYTYLSDCAKVIFSSCDQGTWTIEARARDQGSGLLQLTSNPKGLIFQEGFTTGTKEEVKGTYSDSCCNADIQLIATDRLNNRKTVTANAYRAMWGPGQIAALILGILLFLLLVALVIYLIVKCVKKRKQYDLPTYRGGRI